MCLHSAFLWGCIITMVAFVWLFSAMCFQMFPQIACPGGCILHCLRGWIVTLAGFVCFFLHCGFLNVSSNHLHKRMQSHSGYICLTFLHCVFSSGSANCLHKGMHNHTGCICLTFRHCVFSNVASKNLQKYAKSHWLHLFDFSPLCMFKCAFKWPAWKEICSHWLHLWVLPTSWR